MNTTTWNFLVVKGLRQRVAKVREFVAVTEINLDPVSSTRPEILHRYLQQGGWYSDFTAETPSTRASTVEHAQYDAADTQRICRR